jgi:hypothetical protein
VLCGLGALTRASGLLLVVPAALGVWTVLPRLRARALAPPLLVALCAVVTVAPWVARNTLAFGRFVGVTTQGGYALAATYNPQAVRLRPPGRTVQPFRASAFRDLYRGRDLDEAVRGSQLTSRAVDFVVAHPGFVLQVIAVNTLRTLELHRDDSFEIAFQARFLQGVGLARLASPMVPAALYVVLLIALVGAGAQALAFGPRRAPAFVWLFPLVTVLPAVAIYGLARYRAPLDPFLLILAAVALVAADGARRGHRGSPHRAPLRPRRARSSRGAGSRRRGRALENHVPAR